MDELYHRIARVYSAISAVVETDMSQFPATIFASSQIVYMHQDFKGGMSNADIANVAHSVIYNIAHFEDHVRKWARASGKDAVAVKQCMKDSLALRIIKDLSDADKHSGPRRNGGWSGRDPKLSEINRVLRLTTGSSKGSGVTLTLSPRGEPVIRGSGSSCVVITGQVVDGNGAPIACLYDLELEAINAWEQLLATYGVAVTGTQ